jgi:hypothetical protein
MVQMYSWEGEEYIKHILVRTSGNAAIVISEKYAGKLH